MTRNVTFNLSTRVTPTFRARLVSDTLGLTCPESIQHPVSAQLPADDKPWQIGVIAGPSGSGKSTIARLGFSRRDTTDYPIIHPARWPRNTSLLDGFGIDVSHVEIAQALMAVGLGNLRDWIKPYGLLSTGQQARADLARALTRPAWAPVVVDEFTSTLDRQTAQLVSMAVARAIRSGKVDAEKVIFVTCHHDVIPWLTADWVVTMPQGTLDWGLVQRPGLEFQLRSCSPRLWSRFKEHHYLSASLHNAARCYALCHEGEPIGFCATMASPGVNKTRRKIHRLVVLPEWQGVGAGMALLNAVAQLESATGSIGIVTSHPGLAQALKKDQAWRCLYKPQHSRPHTGLSKRFGRTVSTHTRLTISFEYIPQKQAQKQVSSNPPTIPVS